MVLRQHHGPHPTAATLGIVLASKGYPGAYEKGHEIGGLDAVDGTVYHMGTKADGDRVLTAGGRMVVLRMPTSAEALALPVT